MSVILRFPVREFVRVQYASDGDGWLVLTHRGHGWLHGDHAAAIRDAKEVAIGFGVIMRSS
jgi:hypothetical protein